MTPQQQRWFDLGLLKSVATPLRNEQVDSLLASKGGGVIHAKDKIGPPPAANFKKTPGPRQGVEYVSPYARRRRA